MAARLSVAAALLAALCLAACGGGGGKTGLGATGTTTAPPVTADAPDAPYSLFATKNTTRVDGADAAADAAAVAEAVYPGVEHPPAIALVDDGDWRVALAASVLMAAPTRAPVLLSHRGALPGVSQAALDRLSPAGAPALGGAQIVRVGQNVPQPSGLRTTDVGGADAFALAAALDRLSSAGSGQPSAAVVIASADAPAYAMPAAAWAAKSGDPVLFVRRDGIPRATRRALRTHDHPAIYVLGPQQAVSARVERRLGRFGTVTRIAGPTPQETAIAFARFSDGAFGWGVVDPGHGLVLADPADPLTAAAAAPLSASGTYGPLLLVDDDGGLPDPLAQYLLDIQPGYQDDPVRGVYNHAWLVGDEGAISLQTQSRVDALLEISPVNDTAAP